MPPKNYVLTLMAERHLAELTAFSLDHWGERETQGHGVSTTCGSGWLIARHHGLLDPQHLM